MTQPQVHVYISLFSIIIITCIRIATVQCKNVSSEVSSLLRQEYGTSSTTTSKETTIQEAKLKKYNGSERDATYLVAKRAHSLYIIKICTILSLLLVMSSILCFQFYLSLALINDGVIYSIASLAT